MIPRRSRESSEEGLSLDLLISRQPIFDNKLRVYGYELFFRSGVRDIFRVRHPDEVMSDWISEGSQIPDLRVFAGNKRCFLYVTEDVLLDRHLHLLPTDLAVVGIPELLPLSTEVIDACRELKEAGYLLAADVSTTEDPREPLLDLADIVNVRSAGTGHLDKKTIEDRIASPGIRLIAGEVTTPTILEEAKAMDFDYFQGNFFKVPVVIRGKDIPGSKIQYMNLMTEIHRGSFDIAELENIVSQDVSLTYKLLRYINSSFFGLPNQVHSIRHALLLLGAKETKKWVTIIVITGMTSDHPKEILVQTLVRAKFCEHLAGPAGLPARGDELFLMGMISLLDVMLGRPLDRILRSLPVPNDIAEGLLGGKSTLGQVFRLAVAHENSDWDKVSELATGLGLDDQDISSSYRKSLVWAQECSTGLARAA